MANKELVDSEVRQAMTRMAEVFAEDVAAEERLASALLIWPVQQLQYEQRCQVDLLTCLLFTLNSLVVSLPSYSLPQLLLSFTFM